MKENKNKTKNKILAALGEAAGVILGIVVLIGSFFLQKVVPKLPFEPVSFYCKRTTDMPFVYTREEYNMCMRKYTGPSEETMRYVKSSMGQN